MRHKQARLAHAMKSISPIRIPQISRDGSRLFHVPRATLIEHTMMAETKRTLPQLEAALYRWENEGGAWARRSRRTDTEDKQ
jgi:hypothetical protein